MAPRYRLTTALVLTAVLVALSFWSHVLALAPPGVTMDELMIAALQGNYRHFTQEALAAVHGVVYIFWTEKTKGSMASVPPDSPPP